MILGTDCKINKIILITLTLQITKLPTQLGRLKNLVTLVLDELSLFHPPSFVVEEGTAAILDFMRGKISHSSPWSSMRVVVVGSKGTGKTSLIKRVKGESTSLFTITKGLDVSQLTGLGHMTAWSINMVGFSNTATMYEFVL